MRDDYAFVLDYLPQGYAASFEKRPIAQALGEKYFALLELVMKPGVKVMIGEKVYIGKEKRDKVELVKSRLSFDRLTAAARNELPNLLSKIVEEREKEFVEFFNKARAITIRQHSLELLPSIGKKHMQDILAEREKKPFESFKDIAERVKLLPDPKKIIVERIIEELKGNQKYYLFVKSFPRRR